MHFKLPLLILDDLLPLSDPLSNLGCGNRQMVFDLLERQVDQGALRRSGSGTETNPWSYSWTIPAFSSSWEPSRLAHGEGLVRLLAGAERRGLL